MSLITIYKVKYQVPNITQRIEPAVMTAVQDIINEDPSTPDHENRIAWAEWANLSTGIAATYFQWPLAMNPSIQASIETDPSGESVPDGDIQFVVNSNLDIVIAQCIKNPPAGFNPVTPSS